MIEIREGRFLYFDGKFKQCANGHIKPIGDFYTHGNKKTISSEMSSFYRPYCKPCLNLINSRRRLEKKRSQFPGSFWDCDICDHIVNAKKMYCDKCGCRRNA
jgi:hypothetical protein